MGFCFSGERGLFISNHCDQLKDNSVLVNLAVNHVVTFLTASPLPTSAVKSVQSESGILSRTGYISEGRSEASVVGFRVCPDKAVETHRRCSILTRILVCRGLAIAQRKIRFFYNCYIALGRPASQVPCPLREMLAPLSGRHRTRQ